MLYITNYFIFITTMTCSQSVWKLKFDETFQQYYYINTVDNSISFDLPCEVKSKNVSGSSKLKNHLKRISPTVTRNNSSSGSSSSSSKRPSLLTKIGSALSIKSSKSDSSSIKSAEEEPEPLELDVMDDSASTLTDNKSIITGFDEVLLQPAFNLNKYNTDDMLSILSDESIHSYYSDINQNDVYYDYIYDNYSLHQVPNVEHKYNYDNDYNKEKERLELRLQFQKELEI